GTCRGGGLTRALGGGYSRSACQPPRRRIDESFPRRTASPRVPVAWRGEVPALMVANGWLGRTTAGRIEGGVGGVVRRRERGGARAGDGHRGGASLPVAVRADGVGGAAGALRAV